MKRSLKKLVSLVLVFAMSVAIAVPGFAAQSNGVSPNKQSSESTFEIDASGKPYGPWFGNSTSTYSTQGDIYVGVTFLTAALGCIAPYLEVNAQAAIVAALGTMGGITMNSNLGDYVYGTVKKRYREVYVSGEFAYWQTERTVISYVHRNGTNQYTGTATDIHEGSMMMRDNA